MININEWLLFAEPVLTPTFAHIITLSFGATYVGVLYLSQKVRVSIEAMRSGGIKGTRDDPEVIRRRLIAVSLATIACCIGVFSILFARSAYNVEIIDFTLLSTLMRLGLMPVPRFSLLPHLVVPLLFLGPLFATFLSEELPFQRRWRWQSNIRDRFLTIIGMRNYVVAPITEELTFRACVISVWHMAGISRFSLLYLSPLTFGLAHIHHAVDVFHRNGGNIAALKRAALVTAFQLAYTTVFGILTTFIFLRTGSIFPSITAHAFCNVMGIPDIAWELRRHPKHRIAIYTAYVIGIVGFFITITRWTKTPTSMYWHDETVVRDLIY